VEIKIGQTRAGLAGKVDICTEGKKWAAEDGSNPLRTELK
jgi:hypothetical protein